MTSSSATREHGQGGGGALAAARCAAHLRRTPRRTAGSRRRSERCDDEKCARARRRLVASRPKTGLNRPRSRPPEGEHEERPNLEENVPCNVRERVVFLFSIPLSLSPTRKLPRAGDARTAAGHLGHRGAGEGSAAPLQSLVSAGSQYGERDEEDAARRVRPHTPLLLIPSFYMITCRIRGRSLGSGSGER